MADRWEPVPVPQGDGRHDIGDDTRAAIFHRLHDDFTLAAPWMTAEQRRHLAMFAAASVRALLHELGTLRDMAARAEGSEPAQPTGWQPIETAMPPKDTYVLTWLCCGQAILYWSGDRWDDGSGDSWQDYEPTHWMPLPAPPESGERR